MRPRASGWLLAVAITALVLGCAARHASPAAQQAAAGERLYAARCAACHDTDDATGPELTADLLASYRRARPLFDYTRMAMPYDAPGSMADREYLQTIAFLLTSRHLLPGPVVLDSAGLDTLRISR